MSSAKVQRGYIYKADGIVVKVQPANGKKFELSELQAAVGGYIESLIPGIKGCRQMYANENGIAEGLPDNPYTQKVCNMKIYRANGYDARWRVQGNIIAVLSEAVDENQFSTVAEVMKLSLANIKRRLQVGQKIQMVRHDWAPGGVPVPKVAAVRAVVKVQTNGVQFEGGSWLYFDQASSFCETAKGFDVALDATFDKRMSYEWRD